MSNPFQVVKDFEQALCEYTGAPYCVTTTSCTMALLLAVAWYLQDDLKTLHDRWQGGGAEWKRQAISIPNRTYVGVAMSIIHAGGWPAFRDAAWSGAYRLDPLPIWDSARRFRRGMYSWSDAWNPARGESAPSRGGEMVCLSFHWSKVLGIEQGGAILLADPEADRWLRMARFDGRQQGVAPTKQKNWILGYHAYLSPETAAKGLMRLSLLKGDEPDLPNSDYPDLSTLRIFQ